MRHRLIAKILCFQLFNLHNFLIKTVDYTTEGSYFCPDMPAHLCITANHDLWRSHTDNICNCIPFLNAAAQVDETGTMCRKKCHRWKEYICCPMVAEQSPAHTNNAICYPSIAIYIRRNAL